jgi:cell division transport system permease protein
MSVSYIFKESFSGFKKAKMSGIITLFTITVSLLLLGIFILVLTNFNDVVQNIRDRIEIEAFIQDKLPQAKKDSLYKHIINIYGIRTAKFISKDEAAKIFSDEFGEDINKVLDFNPLPESFRIALIDDVKNSEDIQKITQEMKAIEGIDDVMYRKTLLELLDRRARIFSEISFVIGIIISLISIFLISNTIRLIIHSKQKIIETMKLVGANSFYIKVPFILEGLLHGFIAGIIASLILFSIIDFILPIIGEDLFTHIKVSYYFFPAIILLGCTLSLIGSLLSTKIFIGKKR